MTTKEALGSLRLSCSPSEDCRGCVNVQSCEHKKAYAVLTAMAEDYEEIKAEVERLNKCVEAERKIKHFGEQYQENYMVALEKAEAELARWKPLIEAAERAGERDLHVEQFGAMTASSHAVLRAALECRKGKP